MTTTVGRAWWSHFNRPITVLEVKDGKPVCRELPEAEIDLHKEAVTNAENHLKEFNLRELPKTPTYPD